MRFWKRVSFSGTFLFLPLIAFSLRAQDPPIRATKTRDSIRGTVVRTIAPDHAILVQTPDGREYKMYWDERSRFLDARQAIRAVDLRPNAAVKIYFDQIGERYYVAELATDVAPVARLETVKSFTVEGKVVRIQSDPSVLILQTADGKELILPTDARTRILTGQREVRLSQLTAGIGVRVNYELRPVVTSIAPLAMTREEIPAPTPVIPLTPATAVTTARGKIVRIDQTGNVLVLLTADGKEVRFRADPRAKILWNKRVVSLADLPVGTQVSTIYDVRDGTYIASSIEGPVTTVVSPVLGTGRISGVVLEGDRPQPGLQVILQTDLGKEVANQATRDDGTFVFENIVPGKYTLTSLKPDSKTAGETPITVEASKIKEATIHLFRP